MWGGGKKNEEPLHTQESGFCYITELNMRMGIRASIDGSDNQWTRCTDFRHKVSDYLLKLQGKDVAQICIDANT